jgi:tripartite-type tricarboxylate transporter receptor subunit TctC
MRKIIVAAAAACVAFASPAMAQSKYPDRPIKLIVPYGPGGGTDITGRIVGDEMERTLGQKIVVENKPGANGLLGLQELMSAKHDGYTLILANQTVNVIAPMLYPKQITFDVEKALIPIARLAEVPNVFAVNKDFPAKTFQEFIDYAKKNPGKVRYTTTGVGSFPHFDVALLAKRAGLDLVHLPNSKGAAASVKDLATGDAQVGMMNVATAGPQVRGGFVRVLALADKKRHPDYPDTPTLGEAGYPGIGTVQWFALLTHADAPPEAIKALHAATVKAVKSPKVQEAFRKQGITPALTETPEEARKWVSSEFAHWRQMFKDVPIQIER